jgi:lysozyme
MLDKLLAQLRDDEGWRESPYRDHLGFLTIGYGFLIDERRAVKMPRAVGDLWLELVAKEKWDDLVSRVPWLSAQPEAVQQALANMAYQLGVDGVLGFRTMLAALSGGDRVRAAEAALDSKWATQTPARAQRVARLIRGD